MNRDEAELLIPDHVAGRLASERRRAVDAALARSAELRRYRARVARFYELDLDIAPARPAARRPFFTPGRAVAAAGIVALVFAAWMRTDDAARAPDRGLVTTTLQDLPELAELPTTDGADGWAADVHEARLIAEFTGKPMLAVYAFPPCPRCREMAPVFDSPPMHDRLAGFARYRVDFVEEIPLPLVMRQSEVAGSIVLQLPAVIITDRDVDFDTLYAVDEESDVAVHVERFRSRRSGAGAVLEGPAFDRARELLLGVPRKLATGSRQAALDDLARVERIAAPSGSRFGVVARELRRRIAAGKAP